jgi:hypothetical protein
MTEENKSQVCFNKQVLSVIKLIEPSGSFLGLAIKILKLIICF